MQTMQPQSQIIEEFLDELYDVVSEYKPTLFWHRQEASQKQRAFIRKALAPFDKTEIREIFDGVTLTKGLACEIIDCIHMGVPPTERQIFLLEKLGVDSAVMRTLTKQDASDLIEELIEFN